MISRNMQSTQYLIPCYISCLVLATLLVSGSAQASASPEEQTLEDVIRDTWVDNVQNGLNEASRALEQMLADIRRAAANCIGIRSELCDALEFEANKAQALGLQSPWAPGKRSSPPKDSRLYNLLTSRPVISSRKPQKLQDWTNGIDVKPHKQRKRCSTNLDFQCQFEDVSKFADMYNYLASADSPGKKRSVGGQPSQA